MADSPDRSAEPISFLTRIDLMVALNRKGSRRMLVLDVVVGLWAAAMCVGGIVSGQPAVAAVAGLAATLSLATVAIIFRARNRIPETLAMIDRRTPEHPPEV